MNLERIVIVACKTCHQKENTRQHVLALLFEFEDEVREWSNPPEDAVRICTKFPRVGIVYQTCNKG